MLKLVRVARTKEVPFYFQKLDRDIDVIPCKSTELYERDAEFFLIDDEDLEVFVQIMAEKFPGTDIEVWERKAVGHCPPGEFALKKVTEDGILP
jgi:hypothetical protein